METMQRNLPRFVFGGIVAGLIVLFSFIVDPNGDTGYLVMGTLVVSLVALITLRFQKRAFRFFRGTAVPYMSFLIFSSSLTVWSLNRLIFKLVHDHEGTPWFVAVPGFLIGSAMVIRSTATTKQLTKHSRP